jgi:hypothetical protein
MKYLLCLPLACAIAVAQTSTPAIAPSPPPVVKPEDKCQIEGTVVNSVTGEPIKKARLSLRPIGQEDGVPYGTFADAAGYFLLNGLDPGTYSLMAGRNGFIMQTYSAKGSTRHATNLTLAAGQRMKEVILKLTPQAVITGRIVDEDGEPLPNVAVAALSVGHGRDGKKQLFPGAGASTNDIGEYRIGGVAPGRYFVSAVHPPNDLNMGDIHERITGGPEALKKAEEGYVATYYPNGTKTESAAPIDVAAGALIQGIDIMLVRERTVRIRGRIVNLSPDSVQYTMVQLASHDLMYRMGMQNTARVDKGGAFELRGVAPGSYTLTAVRFNDDKGLSARVPIEAGTSNIDKIELTLTPGFEISGRLAIEGQPTQNAGAGSTSPNTTSPRPFVSLAPKVNTMMGGPGTQVKEDLTFKLDHVNPERYDVDVGMTGEYYLKSIRIGDRDITDAGADFTQGVPAGEMVIVLNANGGQVDGTVQNEKAEPAAAALVVLAPEASRRSLRYLYKSTGTDQNGHFTIKGVKPGDYKVFAFEGLEFDAYYDPEFLKPLESKGEAVSIKESAHESVQVKVIPVEK